MRKFYSFLLMLAFTCISSVAWGQSYDPTITSDPENNYFSGYQSFSVADIVAGLGLADEAALEALLNGEGNNVYLKTADGQSNAYTGNHNEFWMNAEGVAQGYSDEGTCWYAGLYYDPAGVDEDTSEPYESDFYVAVGQMPGFFSKVYTDTDLSCVLYLVNGDKTLTFNVKLHVNAAPEPTTVKLSELEIVKDYTLFLNFVVGKSYEGKTYSATLEDVYDALGTTAEEFDAKAAEQTYTQTYININADDTEKDAEYVLVDALSLPEDAAGGAWFGRYENFDEGTGNPIPLEINAPKGWNTGANTFYTQDITLADGVYSITSGQFGGVLKAEDTDYTYLYLVNGSKAARIKVQVVMEEPQNVDPSLWEEVGTIPITQNATKISNYLRISTVVENIAEIATNLGLEDPADITYYHLPSAGEGFSDDLSDGWGAWLNETGNYCAWGSDARIMVAFEENDDTEGVYQFSTLQMEGNVLNDGDEFEFPVYLANPEAGKYYTVNFKYTITLPEITIDPADWTQEYEDDYTVQLIASEAYAQDASSKTTIDLAAIAEAIGTDDPTLYGEKWTDGVMEYSDAYSCDPNPGFWMADDGISVGGWSETAAYGMTYANGVITYYVHHATVYEAGQTFDSNFYLVNEENGKYAKITLNVIYVDERTEIIEEEPVGEQDVLITLSEDTYNEDNGQYYSPVVDWASVFVALGMAPEDFEGAMWMVQKKANKFIDFGSTGEFDMEAGTMDENGLYLEGDAAASATFAVGLNISDSPSGPTDLKFTFSSMGEDVEDGTIYATKVAIKTDNGYYVFNITAVTENTLQTGINGVAAAKAKAGKIYDINGREVTAPVKGLYIQNGKKYFVK